MQFLEPEVVELTRTVWETVLNLPIEPVDADVRPRDDEETISACVHISGGWAGSCVLTCPTSLGRAIAAAMFALEPDEVDEELLYDAVGEVANMIGGNVKGLVPGPSQLSLPAVATGIHTRLAVPGSHEVTKVSFRSGDDPVRVVLMEVNDTKGGSAHKAQSDQQSPVEVA